MGKSNLLKTLAILSFLIVGTGFYAHPAHAQKISAQVEILADFLQETYGLEYEDALIAALQFEKQQKAKKSTNSEVRLDTSSTSSSSSTSAEVRHGRRSQEYNDMDDIHVHTPPGTEHFKDIPIVSEVLSDPELAKVFLGARSDQPPSEETKEKLNLLINKVKGQINNGPQYLPSKPSSNLDPGFK